ncbi:flagellar hook-associated protein FlgL [Halopseudomonas salegens]|uniref:Flagellar hook-associated protein 3 FlgL n=1 Tax=Halopseudomonas salegens TaxID=1434072 RepID=A0A1H2GCM3_9GAMM|nr:flagellar hook-associated protein FlgL [Halopseudomonas salegens]SDU17211.1 flagellar hook-associated protein 3 FlgL [Halopseudomonas salegens]
MRISTIQAFNNGVRGIQDNYAQVSRTQEQVSSGKRILSPADDPVATVRLLQLGQQGSQIKQYEDNLRAARNSLVQEESVLNGVNNSLQRVREISLMAGNGSYSVQDRQALAQELGELEDELFQLFNTRNARGEYLFGGYQSDQAPFVRESDGSYSYQGDEGQRSIQIGSSKMVAINDSGKSLFVDVANVNRVNTAAQPFDPANPGNVRISLGEVENKRVYDEDFYPNDGITIRIGVDAETYEVLDTAGNPLLPPVTGDLEAGPDGSFSIRHAGVVVKLDGELQENDEFTVDRGDLTPASDNREKRSILDTVALLRDTLANDGDDTESRLQRRDVLSLSVSNIDNAMNQVLGVQTSLGARLNIVDSSENELAESKLINQTITSELEDLDYAEALSRLSMQSVVLEAAQQSFVKISSLNLFNFIR